MDLQLNITTSKNKNKESKPLFKQNESMGYKILSKPVVSGKIIARKRKSNSRAIVSSNIVEKVVDTKHNSKQKNSSNTSSKPLASSDKELGTRLKDLSENKGKFKDKNFQDLSDDIKVKSVRPRTGGWISSLFKNNPSVPKLGQRAVRPIVEHVFSGKEFTDLNIHSHSIANIHQNLQLKELTTVQQMATPIILQGRDVLIRSQTGSGKTLAYTLPIVEGLQAIRPKINRHDGIQVVVIVPTRELAVQTYELFVKLVKPFTWVVPGLLSGGQKRKAEKARLRKGLNILIGTPGRVCDHLRQTQSLNFNKTRCLVLDEADRLLDMGYEKDVAEIVKAIDQHKVNSTYNPMAMIRNSVKKKFNDDGEEFGEKSEKAEKEEVETPKHNITKVLVSNERQTILLSATLSKAVENLAGITMKDPVFVDTSEGKAPVIADSLKVAEKHSEKLPEKAVFDKSCSANTTNLDEQTEEEKVILEKDKKGLKPFVGSRFGDLFEKATEKLLISKGLHSTTEESDSDSDYDYFKAPKQTVNEQLETGVDEKDGEKDDSFKKAISSAIEEDKIVLPSTVEQNFLITPMKLRLVTLCASIVEHCVLNKKGGKMIVFMATQEMVDYHSDILEKVLTESGKKEDKKSKKIKKGDKDDSKESSEDEDLPSDFEINLPGEPGLEGLIPISLEIFKLFGSMPHEERIDVFKRFRKAKAGVLFCTDVAARGLDLPKVDLVFQYCAPTSVTDYVHRVGRTGRAACIGAATLLLLPTETDYVRLLEEKRIRLKQLDDKSSLESLRTIVPTANSAARAAVCIQARIEKTVLSNKEWLKRASRAYTSWVRFYAGYPRAVRECLDNRNLHLGHAAKSFGLRDPPGTVARRVKNDPDANKPAPSNRLTVDKDIDAKREGFPKMKLGGKRNFNKQSSMHTASEFDSGLEPTVKKKKK